MPEFVAGVDGCRAGWVVVLMPLGRPDAATISLAPTFADILARDEAPAHIAIDIPIGLPDVTGPGGRGADVAARKVLGARQSSVFAMPSRRAVYAETYQDACAAAFATSDPPRKVSKQAYYLFPKVREVDRLMTPDLQARVREVHPEVAFWALNGKQPVGTPKKIKSRVNPEGMAERRALLVGAGFDAAFLTTKHFLAKDAGADDILDAAVNCWTAARLAEGIAIRFPETPDIDGRGLRQEIWG
ncbi:MAG: DUF429 domain-containing protein [Pseudomonadota bacterium]